MMVMLVTGAIVSFSLYLIVGMFCIEISKDRAGHHGRYERNLGEISRLEGLGDALFCWLLWPLYVKVMLEGVPPLKITTWSRESLSSMLAIAEQAVRRCSGRRVDKC